MLPMKKILLFMLCFSALSAVCLQAEDLTQESTCYGTTKNGRIDNAARLPTKGVNFVSYSTLAVLAGRSYVHTTVREVILNAFNSLEKARPNTIYMYGETGFKNGGPLNPHKTHQNGLSVDFMVPVLNKDNQSVPLPTGPFNKFGYSIEFDKQGKFKDLSIDFEAMAAHIKALHVEARKQGINLWRVLFDPGLQPFLYDTPDGGYITQHILIPKKRSWVRHDEHYHVDFDINCEPL